MSHIEFKKWPCCISLSLRNRHVFCQSYRIPMFIDAAKEPCMTYMEKKERDSQTSNFENNIHWQKSILYVLKTITLSIT